MKIYYLFFLVLLLTHCHGTNHCEGIACVSAPRSFNFELVDKTSGDNLFTKGELHADAIAVTSDNDLLVDYRFITENNLNVISITNIGWQTGLKTYHIKVGDSLTIHFKLNMKRNTQNCCTFYEVVEFTVLNYEIQEDTSTGVIKVKIDGLV